MNPVERLWSCVEARDWEGARETLAEDFECEWPHTGERFAGRDAYTAVNQAFPDDSWHIELQRVVMEGDLAVAEVRVPSGGGVSLCVGWYELHAGRIARATEYWVDPDPGAIPEWRRNRRFND